MIGKPEAVAIMQHRVSESPLDAALDELLALVHARTGHDLSHYKRGAIRRRVERRMEALRLDGLAAYVRYVACEPSEVDSLSKSLLIGVTSFFRDRDAFEALRSALDELVARRPRDHVVRVWIPGCS